MIDPNAIEIWACPETARAHAVQSPHKTLELLGSMPLGVHILLCDDSVPDIADAARSWALMFPMTFLIWLRGDAEESVPPEVDAIVDAAGTTRAALTALVISWLYDDARFKVPVNVSGRKFRVLTCNDGLFTEPMSYVAAQLSRAGAMLVHKSTPEEVAAGEIMEVYIGPVVEMHRHDCHATGLYWLMATEQPQGFKSEFITHAHIFQKAEHILACSHVNLRHLRSILKPDASISLTPAMWAMFNVVSHDAASTQREGALQLGGPVDRRAFVQNLCEASRTHDAAQIKSVTAVFGKSKHDKLQSTRLLFIPNSNERPTFTPMHRIAEVWACGPLILTERTDDTVAESILQKMGHVVCSYGQLPRAVQAALAMPDLAYNHLPIPQTRKIVDSALQPALDQNWLKPVVAALDAAPLTETRIQGARRPARAETSAKKQPVRVVRILANNASAKDALANWRIAGITLSAVLLLVIVAFITTGVVMRKSK